MSDLERFRRAQNERHAGITDALGELRSGRKTGHWIWYVFPQLFGLGQSEFSRRYGIGGVAEATNYLRDEELRTRLLSAAIAVVERTREGISIPHLMGSAVDATKLVSSMTLFGAVAGRLAATAPNDDYQRVADLAGEILTAAAAEGIPACAFTRRALDAR